MTEPAEESARDDQVEQGPAQPPEVRVLTIELFFDLVFVFAITQLTSLLAGDPSVVGLATVALIFGNLWWMYGGYAWLTNAVPPRSVALRLLVLVGMLGFLILALAIPTAFGAGGVAFGLGYLLVTLVHTGMFMLSTQAGVVRAMRQVGSLNLVAALMLLLAGFAGGALRWALWSGAFTLLWGSPAFMTVSSFRIRAGHFVERHGLIVLIALGESIVAIGIGVTEHTLQAGLVVTAVLGLVLAAALWWLYFDGEDERAEHALAAAPAERAPWLSLYAFGFAFLPVLGGIIVLAAGVKEAVERFGEPLPAPAAWSIAGGVCVYVLGLAWLRWLLGTGPVAGRLAIAGAALPTALVGMAVSPEAQLGVLAPVVVAGMAVTSAWERRRLQRPGARSPAPPG